MPIKLFEKCDECKKKVKKPRLYKAKRLCGNCYRSHFTIIPATVFKEPMNVSIGVSVSITETQKKLLDKRVKYLFPNKPTKRKYLRALIMGDLESYEKKLRRKKKSVT